MVVNVCVSAGGGEVELEAMVGDLWGGFYEYTVVAVSGSVGSSACGHEVADGGFGKRSLENVRERL